VKETKKEPGSLTQVIIGLGVLWAAGAALLGLLTTTENIESLPFSGIVVLALPFGAFMWFTLAVLNGVAMDYGVNLFDYEEKKEVS